jgi:hypothetical protein
LGDKIEKNGVDGACSTYTEGRGVYRILVGSLKEGDHNLLEHSGPVQDSNGIALTVYSCKDRRKFFLATLFFLVLL